jgi:hypothetical protein
MNPCEELLTWSGAAAGCLGCEEGWTMMKNQVHATGLRCLTNVKKKLKKIDWREKLKAE